MPEELMIPAGNYKLRKRFRPEEIKRKRRDIPWQKKVLNLDTNEFFNRTAWAWFRIICFYIVLYLAIILILAVWFLIFKFTVSEDSPKWLKGAPGLSVVPRNNTLISWYTHLEKQIHPITEDIAQAMKALKDNAEKFFHECNPDGLWGYGKAKTPCVFVKLNKVIGFTPETYDTVDDLPSNAPGELIDILGKYGGKSRIWLTCKVTKGKSPTIVYVPGPYYDASTNMRGRARIVALKLTEMPQNQEVHFKCRVWAKNIPVDEKIPGNGNVKFRLRMRVDSTERFIPTDTKLSIQQRVFRPHFQANTSAVKKHNQAKKKTASLKKQKVTESPEKSKITETENTDPKKETQPLENPSSVKQENEKNGDEDEVAKLARKQEKQKVTEHSKEEDDMENTMKEHEKEDGTETEAEKLKENKEPKAKKVTDPSQEDLENADKVKYESKERDTASTP